MDADSVIKANDNRSGFFNTELGKELAEKEPLINEIIDPADPLPKEEVEKCIEKADAKLAETNVKELNLAKSDIQVPGQQWVLVSFVGHGLRQKSEHLGMKVWGAFDDIKEAHEHAGRINRDFNEKIFDVYVLEMYTWAVVPPDPKCIKDQNYHEKALHELITDHKRRMTVASEVFDRRKEILTDNAKEFNENKAKLKALNDAMAEFRVGSETHTQKFGLPEKLPELQVLDQDDNPVKIEPNAETRELEPVEESLEDE